ncbi:MAG: hypothetical protein ACKOPM_04115 [Novosphingobium sp.]
MPDEYYSSSPATTRGSGGVFRAVLGTALLAFVAGAALVGWLIWDGRIALPGREAAAPQVAGSTAAMPLPAPGASTSTTQGLELQIAALEQRLARIDLQTAATEGNTARAEAMLVALAARRAVERGVPLGYLEDQLRLRFGAARPSAVNTVIAANRQPTTLAQLSADLETLAPALRGEGPEETVWGRFRRQVSGLFVVHRDAPGASDPQNRLAQAQVLLRSGQVDAAIELVAAMPGGKAAEGWIARAKRYSETMSALDQIEQAALAEPEKLKAGTGEEVRQPGPAVTPTPTAPASPAPREATF